MEEIINILVEQSVKPSEFDERVYSLCCEFDYTTDTIHNYIIIDGFIHTLSDDFDIFLIDMSDVRNVYCI